MFSDNHKFALIGVNTWVEQQFEAVNVRDGMRVLSEAKLPMDDFWTHYLGEARVEDIQECPCFLLIEAPSKTLGVFDGENKTLQACAMRWLKGLVLATGYRFIDPVCLLQGSIINNRPDVRSVGVPMNLVRPPWSDEQPVDSNDFLLAAKLGNALEFDPARCVDEWRLRRALNIYFEGRSSRFFMESLHQFVRSAEALIGVEANKGSKQFALRVAILFGGNQTAYEGLYRRRSEVEHVNEDKFIFPFERGKMIEITKQLDLSEQIARTLLCKTLLDPELRQAFGSHAASDLFWQMTVNEQKKIGKVYRGSLKRPDRLHLDEMTDEELGRSP